MVSEQHHLHFIPLKAGIFHSFWAKRRDWAEKKKGNREVYLKTVSIISVGSDDGLTSMKRQKKASQPVINLIYENNTTGLKHSTVQPLILLSCSSGSHCCVWYGELQIVLLYHLNVVSAIQGEQLRSGTLTGKRQESVFHFFREKRLLGWQIFPVGKKCCCFFFQNLSLFPFVATTASHVLSSVRGTGKRVNRNVPDLWSFLTSGIICFNVVVGKSAVTCQKIKQPIFHHKLNKHWKVSILQGPLAYVSL